MVEKGDFSPLQAFFLTIFQGSSNSILKRDFEIYQNFVGKRPSIRDLRIGSGGPMAKRHDFGQKVDKKCLNAISWNRYFGINFLASNDRRRHRENFHQGLGSAMIISRSLTLGLRHGAVRCKLSKNHTHRYRKTVCVIGNFAKSNDLTRINAYVCLGKP